MKRSWAESVAGSSRAQNNGGLGGSDNSQHNNRDQFNHRGGDGDRQSSQLNRSLSFGATSGLQSGDASQNERSSSHFAAGSEDVTVPGRRMAAPHDAHPGITRRVTACAACR